jgi:hypothetical protein
MDLNAGASRVNGPAEAFSVADSAMVCDRKSSEGGDSLVPLKADVQKRPIVARNNDALSAVKIEIHQPRCSLFNRDAVAVSDHSDRHRPARPKWRTMPGPSFGLVRAGAVRAIGQQGR